MNYGYDPMRETFAEIGRMLERRNWPYELDSKGNYRLYQGSTYVTVSVKMWGERIMIYIKAPVAIDVTNLNYDVLYKLLENNYNLVLGKFSYSSSNRTIFYEHTIIGTDPGGEGLAAAIETAGVIADRYDDEIALMSGGRRAID